MIVSYIKNNINIAKKQMTFKPNLSYHNFFSKIYKPSNATFLNTVKLKTAKNLEDSIPAKAKISESDLIEREKKLKDLAEKWKKNRIRKEEYERKVFGFYKNSEILNGRVAMFFFVTGLLTEFWTKQSLFDQIETMFRAFGFYE